MNTPLVCPAEGRVLEASGTALACPACGASYPVIDGIPSFVGDLDPDQVSEQAKRDEEAGLYDGIFSATQNFIEIPPLVEGLRLRQGARVLEVAVGTGRILREYLRRCSEVVGVDFSMASLRQLRRTLHPTLEDRVRLVHGDACRLPFADGAFDRVLCAGMLHHLPTEAARAACVASLARVLAPGGRLVLQCYLWSGRKKRRARTAPGAAGPASARTGRHSDGQIFFHNLAPEELRGLLEPHFRIERLYGQLQDLPGLQRLGVFRPVVERAVEHTPLSLHTGTLAVAEAVRRG